MDTRQLELFMIAYESKSFSGAAERAFISQQGISNSIAQLENELETQLFQRTNRGIIPTSAGEKLYHFALTYTGDWSALKSNLTGDSPERSLRVGLDIGFMELLPHDIFTRYILEHPHDQIFIENYVDVCKNRLLNGKIDLGFCSPPVDHELFDTVFEVSRKIQLVLSKSNPLAGKQSVRISDLKGFNLIDIDLNTPVQLYYRNLCRQNGIIPNIRLNASQGMHIAEMVSNNAAVSFYAGEANWLPENVVLLPFEDMDLSFGFQLVTRKNARYSESMSEFIALLKSYYVS